MAALQPGVSPTAEKPRVNPGRRENRAYRTREHLTPDEAAKLIEAAATRGRWRQRDAAMLLITYRHGLRASEVCDLQWDAVDFKAATLHVNRAKGGTTATHPLRGDELRALRTLRKANPHAAFMFVTERGTPFSVDGLNYLIKRAGVHAGIPFPVHAHMLRHATGYALANRGVDTRTLQDYLGHRSIQSTVRYTVLAPGRFKGLWD
jgi:type 1 fimbriae regulatory protein FimB/type 1 fimbriae regulatory protein FimE